jgi:hypothetical protein
LKNLPVVAELHEQFFHAWRNWMSWAWSSPQKRRARAQVGVSDEITSETRAAGHKTMAPVTELLERDRVDEPWGKLPWTSLWRS